MTWINRLKHWLEFLGGARDHPPQGYVGNFGWVAIAVWWLTLLGAIAVFCGQTSKFIYIDF